MSATDDIYHWLIAPIENRMLRTVTHLVRDPDEAADALQNALAQVWRDLERIILHPNPHAYILRVCVSAAYDVLRRRSRRRHRETSLEGLEEALMLAGGEESPARAALDRELREDLLQAIATLPPQQAQALLLRVMEEQSFEEIAAALGCSEATARSHVSKARERLRRVLRLGKARERLRPVLDRPAPAREVEA